MDKRITEAAGLLRQASDMLLSMDSQNASSPGPSSSTPSTSSVATPESRPERRPAPVLHETLARAREMMQSSRSNGVFRRLNSNERLRATSGPKAKKSKKATTSKAKDKPFEFALLSCGDEDQEDDNLTLKKDMILDRDIVSLGEQDTEATIREKLASSLKGKYGIIGPNDFEFIKVTQKKILILHLSKGTEYNYDVVKKLVGQGLLYTRIKKGYEFVIEHTSDSDSDLGKMENNAATTEAQSQQPNVEQTNKSPQTSDPPLLQCSSNTTGNVTYLHVPLRPGLNQEESPNFFHTIVNEFPSSITEPTEMFRYLQKKIVRGRPLEVTNPSVDLEGETNFITVDRENILQTTFEELKVVTDPRITFEVQFYGEEAADHGGQRKEWIRLCNQNIKLKYFDNNLKEHLSEDYYYVGQMISIALLQNGQLPVYLPEEVLQATFFGNLSEKLSPCIVELKRGMDTLGVAEFGRKLPLLLHLLRPSASTKLSVRQLLFLLKPNFAEEGSNRLIHEKAMYTIFVKYVRDVSSDRRITTLSNILEFVTGASEEPPLGFAKGPHIQFREVESTDLFRTKVEGNEDSEGAQGPDKWKKAIGYFMPTSHTCSNTLDLPAGSIHIPLTPEEDLFKLYDLAFVNAYFGIV